jgi:hypothetical protein
MSRYRPPRLTTTSAAQHPLGRLPSAVLLIAGLVGVAAAAAQPTTTEGLRWSPTTGLISAALPGPWSSRFGWNDAATDPAIANPVTARLSWQWLGDYRFGAAVGGLRATGGVLGWLDRSPSGSTAASPLRLSGGARPAWAGAGSGNAAGPGESLWATPYLGLGYDTATPLRSGWGGWGLSADVGWVTRRAGGSSLRFGAQGDAEDGWRSLRLAPMLQLGVSYAF